MPIKYYTSQLYHRSPIRIYGTALYYLNSQWTSCPRFIILIDIVTIIVYVVFNSTIMNIPHQSSSRQHERRCCCSFFVGSRQQLPLPSAQGSCLSFFRQSRHFCGHASYCPSIPSLQTSGCQLKCPHAILYFSFYATF